MPEPEGDDGGVDASLQQGHGAAVAHHVWMDSLAQQGGTSLGGGRGVGADPERNGIAAEPSSGPGREQRVVEMACSLGEPEPQQHLDALVEGDSALLASFAFAADVGSGAQGDVAAVQAGELRNPQPGLEGQQQHDPVSTSFPSGLVRCCHEGVDLGRGQERHGPLVEPLRWDREHALDEQRMLGVAQGGVGEQRTDRGQAHVPGPGAVVPLGLQVRQERRDRGGVQVVPVELRGQLPGPGVDEREQQPKGVAVGRDGAGAGLTLLDEPVGEERLQGRRDQRHDRALSQALSCRAAASASSSGAADRYQ